VRRRIDRLAATVAGIAREEGFDVNHRKTRVMHRSDRQILTGIIVNDKPNLPRAEFDRLKAILTNCVTLGAASQNRGAHRDFRAHLLGRIAHTRTLSAARAAKLHAIFEKIEWRAATAAESSRP
jgi:RNA-directed DNA polymerase